MPSRTGSRDEIEQLAAAVLSAAERAQMSQGDRASVDGNPAAVGISLHPDDGTYMETLL